MLGRYYEEGIACEKSLNQAFDLYQHAAEKGYWESYFYLGRCYENEQPYFSLKKAVNYYKLGMEAHDPLATCALGRLYEIGKGVEQSIPKSQEYFQRAANLGSLEAKKRITTPLQKN